ncbi:MAG: carboxymuconolactone decarboxylase family protein [Thermodesulfobacteriota bacterium]|nr:carboxymuconolactone decarboxylase family protein [Thermodesulfobacteriota bacterium]
MRLSTPRIPPAAPDELDDETRTLLSFSADRHDGRPDNIFATLARHPEFLKKFLVFGSHVLVGSTLPPREREILILRIGWLCRAEYEWGQHVEVGTKAGLTEDEIYRIIEGPDAEAWTAFEAALLRAVDELYEDAFITDGTWNALAKEYDTRQMIDLIFTVGQYNMVSMALNSLGVQLDARLTGFPEE